MRTAAVLTATTGFGLLILTDEMLAHAHAAEQILELVDPKAFYETYLGAPSQPSRGSVGVSIDLRSVYSRT